VGVYDGQRLLVSWRLTSRREQTADEYGVFIQTLLRTRGIEPQHVTGVAISNVVPPVQRTLEWMSEAYFGIHPFTVQPGVNVDVPLNVDNPKEVGADRVCNIVAGVAIYGTPLIVVDFGTATNFYKPNVEGIWYLRQNARMSLGIRGQAQFIQEWKGTKDVPIFEKIFLGGEYTIRGFDLRTIGPQDPVTGLVLAVPRPCSSTPKRPSRSPARFA
jgi:type III pantothenate kinase